MGFIIHGLIEIPVLWLLRTRFIILFVDVPWLVWLKIHWIFTIATEILGIAIVSLLNKKLVIKKNYLLEAVMIVSYILIFSVIIIGLFNCPILNQ